MAEYFPFDVSSIGSYSGSFSGSFRGNGSGITGVTISPSGPNKSIQFNDGGVLNGSNLLTFDNKSNALTITGSLSVTGSTNLNGELYINGQKQFNYGQFSSNITQTGSADTAYLMTFNNTDFSNGVTLVSGSRITVSNTGLYNIQFSTQLSTTASQAVDFSIWFAMTGSNIANSNTFFTIEKIKGGGYVVGALNFLTQITSGSYVELKWSKTTVEGQLLAVGTQITPTRPATPSIIVTVTQVA